MDEARGRIKGETMTPDELRARCKQFISVNSAHGRIVLTDGFNARLESLCREMISEGLEMAAVEMGDSGNDKLNGWVDWCRTEAQRVKSDI